MLIPQHAERTIYKYLCFILLPDRQLSAYIHGKYHEWGSKCNMWKEVTGVFPKEDFPGPFSLLWKTAAFSCCILEYLSSCYDVPPSLEISRKNYLPRNVVDVPSQDMSKASPDNAKGF